MICSLSDAARLRYLFLALGILIIFFPARSYATTTDTLGLSGGEEETDTLFPD